MHINAIGGDCPGKTELDPAILERATVFVEYPEQTRVEGEIQQMAADFEVVEIWQVLTGEARGRSSRNEITLFDSVGFAIEDFSALRFLSDEVEGTSCEKEIDLVASPSDLKDLFGMINALLDRHALRSPRASAVPAGSLMASRTPTVRIAQGTSGCDLAWSLPSVDLIRIPELLHFGSYGAFLAPGADRILELAQ